MARWEQAPLANPATAEPSDIPRWQQAPLATEAASVPRWQQAPLASDIEIPALTPAPPAGGDAGLLENVWRGLGSSFVGGLAGDVETVGLVSGSETVGAAADVVAGGADALRAGQSPEMQAAARKEWITDDGDGWAGPALSDPLAYLNVATSGIGSLASVVITGGPLKWLAKKGLLRALRKDADTLVKRGMDPAAAKTAARKNLERLDNAAGMLGYGAAESALVSGSLARQVEGEVLQMPREVLETADGFQETYAQVQAADPDASDEDVFVAARALIAKSAAVDAARNVALPSFLVGSIAGRYLDHALKGKLQGTRLQRAGKVALAETPTEATQGGIEQATSNLAIAEHADPTRPVGQGVANAAFSEGLGGSIAGTALGLASPAPNDPAAAPPRAPPNNIPAETLIGREPEPAAPLDLLAPGAGPRPPPGGGLFGDGGLAADEPRDDGVTPVDLFNVGAGLPTSPQAPNIGVETPNIPAAPTPSPTVEIGIPRVVGPGAAPNVAPAAPNMPTAPGAPAGLTDFETPDFTAAPPAPELPDTSYVDWQAPRPPMPTGNVAQSPESQATPDLSSSDAGNYKPGKLDSNVQLPKQTDIEAAANQAATSPVNDLPQPSDAQQDAGNYTKGHVKLHGLDISIEHPRGSTRSGTSKAGKRWETPVAHHYGYLRRTEGKDDEQVDIYLGPAAENPELPVFVVDQIDPRTRRFDEHKVMVGFADEQAARDGYRANYATDWDGIGGVQAMTLGEFKAWLKDGDLSKRAAEPDKQKALRAKAQRSSTPSRREIEAFIARAAREADPKEELVLGPTSAREVADIKAQEGPDVSGMEHVLSAERLKHALRAHGDSETERRRDPNQRALTMDDLQAIPAVLADYDRLEVQPRGGNRTSIIYHKRLPNGRMAYVERVIETSRRKKPRLVTRTAWVSSPTGAEASPLPVSTPGRQDTIPRAAPPIKENAPPAAVDAPREAPLDAAPIQATTPKPDLAAPEVKPPELTIADFTNARGEVKSIIVTGDIAAHEARIKQAGPALKHARGFTFAKKHEAAVRAALAELLTAGKPSQVTVQPTQPPPETPNEVLPAEAKDPQAQAAEEVTRPERARETAGEPYVPVTQRTPAQLGMPPEEAARVAELERLDAKIAARYADIEPPSSRENVLDKLPTRQLIHAYKRRAFLRDEGDMPAPLAAADKLITILEQQLAKETPAKRKRTKASKLEAATKPPAQAEVALTDVGAKIGGARKDWRARGLTVADLDAMTAGEEAEHVVKANIWKPDYKAMIEAGAEPRAAALLKVMYDKLAATPAKDTPAGRRHYLKMLGLVRDAYQAVKAEADLKAAREALFKNLNWYEGGSQDNDTRDTVFSVYKGRKNPFQVGYNEQRSVEQLIAKGWPDTHQTKPKAKLADGEAPARPALDQLKRVGPPRRTGNVSAQDFMDAFGFRGVEFGLWAATDERQQHVNEAYDALLDLAETLGVPPKAISLNGSLGVAFGARGTKFAAHYEPGKLVINISKLAGPGAMAHEWGHALDHYFGELARVDAYQGGARGASGWMTKPRAGDFKRLSHLRAALGQAFDGVLGAIYQRDRTQAEVVREAELALERHQADVERVRKAGARFVELGDKVNAKHQRDWLIKHGEPRLKQLQKVLERTRGLEAGQPLGRTQSSYFEQAKKLSGKSADKGYWARPTELFARAFEAYVFDRLGTQNRKTDYLVHGVEPARYASPNYKGNPYPVGLERQAIKQAFDGLFETMQSKETEQGVALYSQGQFGEFSDQLLARRAEVAAELKTIIGKLAPKADLQLFDSLTREVSGRQGYVAGSQLGATINLALNYSDAPATAWHEALHFLKRLGYFSEAEWGALEAQAPKWKQQYQQTDTEEAIAVAFEAFGKRAAKPDAGLVAKAWTRLRLFIQRFGNWLKRRGFQSAEDVFERVASGEVGQRDRDMVRAVVAYREALGQLAQDRLATSYVFDLGPPSEILRRFGIPAAPMPDAIRAAQGHAWQTRVGARRFKRLARGRAGAAGGVRLQTWRGLSGAVNQDRAPARQRRGGAGSQRHAGRYQRR